MRAAVLKEYEEPLVVEERDAPSAADHGVVVEVDACGICRSDWHAWQGHWDWIGSQPPTDQILGHEPAGTVIKVGEDVEHFDVGDAVAIPFNIADGNCPRCHSDRSHLCQNRATLGFDRSLPGAFAEEIHIPHGDFNLSPLPSGASPEDLAGLGCRFMTAYHAMVHRAETNVGDWLAVHGCGGVGLSLIHIARSQGLNVIGVDIKDAQLERARELGADVALNATEVDVPAEVQAITNGGADVSADALGSAETCQNSVLCLAPFGQHLQVGLTSKEEQGRIELPTDIILGKELEFIGSKGMQPNRYPELISLVEVGRLTPSRIVSETVALDDISRVLADMTDFNSPGVSVVTEF
jgi:D-arabinose 1-dehydrogenase-like Zn-dependent alcohol dehydrogenase